jgi:hypothetical protein
MPRAAEDRLRARLGGGVRRLAGEAGSRRPLGGRLKTLDAEAAQALAGYHKRLGLNGLTTLDVDTATALSAYKGECLSLNGRTTLDADTAAALAKFAGPPLALGGITAFESPDSVAIAKALATRQGPLSIPNLEKFSPDHSPVSVPAVMRELGNSPRGVSEGGA